MADHQLRIARALEGIEKATQTLAKTGNLMAQTAAKMQHPAFLGKDIPGVLVSSDDISTSIGLSGPDIDGITTIYQQDDGFVRIEILVEPPASERLMELVDQLPVRQFTLQAIDPV